ncbi:MAG: ABC transporter permease [Planctomycetota bacterium]|jgi:ribose transport system permease protein|nr:ABC transporter permease [Planctomycetota bacterium]
MSEINPDGGISLRFLLDRYSRIMILAIIVAFMAATKPDAFWTMNNLSAVAFQQAPFMILMSFGMTLAIITKGIDKSMGSVLVLSSVIGAGFVKNGQFLAGIGLALAVGVACGFVSGILITRVGVAPFIATYGVEWVTLGLAFVLTGNVYIYDFPQEFREIATGRIFGLVPNLALITLAIFLILHFTMGKTIFGRKVYMVGNNFNAATLSGVNARKTVTMVYIVNGLLAAITGILYMARLNAADPGISAAFTLDSIAASLIGGTSFGGGKGSISGTIVGALIIVFIRNGMNIWGVHTTWQQTAVGFVIIFSIFLEATTQKLTAFATRRRRGGE